MKTYEIQINGIPHTVQLSDEDAAARGVKEAPAPANKSQTPKNKSK